MKDIYQLLSSLDILTIQRQEQVERERQRETKEGQKEKKGTKRGRKGHKET